MHHYEPQDYGTIFGTPANDYLTVTTFDMEAFGAIEKMVQGRDKSPDRFRGYEGYRVGQLRFLMGKQMGRSHAIIIAEGSASEYLIEALSSMNHPSQPLAIARVFKCTRIDCQLSVRDDEFNFRKAKDDMDNDGAKWNRRGRKPEVTMVEGTASKRGLGSTIYVGSKRVKDGHFVRMYEKPDDEGNRWIRFEVQFKGKVADQILFQLTTARDMNPSAYIKQVVMSYPSQVLRDHLGPLVKGLESVEGVSVAHKPERPDDVRRAIWYKYQIMPTLCKVVDERASRFLQRQLARTILVLQANRKKDELIEVYQQMDLKRQQEFHAQYIYELARIEEELERFGDIGHTGDDIEYQIYHQSEFDLGDDLIDVVSSCYYAAGM